MKKPGITCLECCAFSVAGLAIASAAWADEDNDDNELPFSVAQVLLQLNDTDGDLGFHARIDGDPWKRVTIESPSERKLLNIRLRGQLRRQGLTELSFESAEPTFDELDPDVFFSRFPEGPYEIDGKGFDGLEYESVSRLSHLIPAAPDNLSVSGVPAPEDCDGDIPMVTAPIVIAWDAVDSSHADLGRSGDVAIESYEVSVEAETVMYGIDVGGGITQVEIPDGAIPAGEEVKYQILAREAEGNETSSESCFIAP